MYLSIITIPLITSMFAGKLSGYNQIQSRTYKVYVVPFKEKDDSLINSSKILYNPDNKIGTNILDSLEITKDSKIVENL